MPTFCRHNRLIQNCPICSREQQVELRPVVSSSAPRSTQPRPRPRRAAARRRAVERHSAGAGGVRVRRLARGGDDGYRSPLVPGLKSSDEAERLADDLALAATRLTVLASEPPGLYAEVADPAGDLEERTWLAFLVAYIGPLDGRDPFANIRAVRTPWAGGELAGPDGDRAGSARRARRGAGHSHARGLPRLGWARRVRRRPPSPATRRGRRSGALRGRSSAWRCRLSP